MPGFSVPNSRKVLCPSCSAPVSMYRHIQFLTDWESCACCGEMVFFPTAIALSDARRVARRPSSAPIQLSLGLPWAGEY